MSYRLTGEGYVIRIADGAKVPITTSAEYPNTNPDYLAYLQYLEAGNTPDLAPPPTADEQRVLDKDRYKRRAEAKDGLLAYMAADNMSRVRSGAWTVSDLTGLMADPAVQLAQAYMATLSFELVAEAIQGATTPLLTPEIKADWISKLQAKFFLIP